MNKTEELQFQKKEMSDLIRQFYQIQKHRIAFNNQISALDKAGHYPAILNSYFDRLMEMEKDIKKDVRDWIEGFDIWKKYLKNIKGIGEVLAGGLMSSIDIEKAEHVSSLWKYAGLDVIEGKARKKTKGETLTWNPFLKTTCWKISKSFLMVGSDFRKYYDERRIIEDKQHSELSDGHRHNRAMRYMVKMFLRQLWVSWREMEGLLVSEPYVTAKMDGHDYNESIDNK